MRTVRAFLVCTLAFGVWGCAPVTNVLQSDANLGDKLKQLGGVFAEFLRVPKAQERKPFGSTLTGAQAKLSRSKTPR